MPYRVFWSPEAERLLKKLHVTARDSITVSHAADEIDKQLHTDPTEVGESREANVRVGFQEPLGIEFEVMEDVQTVVVFNVWRTDRQR